MKYSLLSLAFLATPAVVAGEPVEPQHYADFSQILDLEYAPNGHGVVLVKQQVDDDLQGRQTNLWLWQAESAEMRQLTYSGQDRQPRFSPDSESLIFSSSRQAGPALYRLPLSGGEAREVLRLEQGSLSNFQWYPDGERLLLTLRLAPEVEDPLTPADDEDTPEADVTIISDAVYKRQGGYLDNQRTSLWSLDLSSGALSPVTPQNNYQLSDAAISPAGDCVSYTENRHPQAHDGYFHADLYVLCEAADEVTVTTPDGQVSSPVWLNEAELLYVHRTGRYSAPDMWLYNHQTGEQQLLQESLDLLPGALQAHDGKGWFVSDNRGSRTLQQLDPRTGEISTLSGATYSVSQVTFSTTGALAWVAEDEVTPPEVRQRDTLDQPEAQTIFAPNQELARRLTLQNYEVFQVENEAGYLLDVFFLPPVGHSGAEPAPVVLNIKGGPGGMWGHQWFLEMQLLASQGYAVVFTNYRGSTGYGHDFQSEVRLDYGGADYADNILALDTALERYPWLDEHRQYITGGSHGGFLTNWATTQTDRFRAAVTQRSVSNWLSEAGTQTFPPLSMQEEFGGTMWENFAYYWGRSPLKYADQVSTPTLIIHSSDDHITPIGQGEEWYYALLANEVKAELAVFSGEGHGLSRTGKPVNLIKRLELILDWFDRHNPDSGTD